MISYVQGVELVRLARLAVEKYVAESVVIKGPEIMLPRSGVFVTIKNFTRNGEDLRGCIGFPLPVKALYESVIDAAIAAATADPRFTPVDSKEVGHLVFEVSVLSTPAEVTGTPVERKNRIMIGRDGLLLKWKYGTGLLLPQVPVELEWNVDEYLANICYKAGAPPEAWLEPTSKLFTFQAAVFREKEPNGKVRQVVNSNTADDNLVLDVDDNNK